MTERPSEPPPAVPTLTEREGYLEAVLQPTTSAENILRQFEEILQVCIVRKPPRLFLDFTAVSGKYSTMELHDLGMSGSRLASHVGRVAVLLTPEVIDPEKFGTRVARNRGLSVDSFVDRAAAMTWLLTP